MEEMTKQCLCMHSFIHSSPNYDRMVAGCQAVLGLGDIVVTIAQPLRFLAYQGQTKKERSEREQSETKSKDGQLHDYSTLEGHICSFSILSSAKAKTVA